MSSFVLLFCLCLFRGVLVEFLTRQRSLNLKGKWIVSNGSVSLPAEVPGCVHTALQKHGYIQVQHQATLKQSSPHYGGQFG